VTNLEIGRLTEEDMREMVRDRMMSQIMFSDEVPDSLLGVVFLPLMMGGLEPPPELVLAKVGERPPAPPEDPEPEPEPLPPLPPAPEKPTAKKIPEEVLFNFRWDKISEEDFRKIEAEVERENAAALLAWEARHKTWKKAVGDRKKALREQEATLREWEQRGPEREAALREWEQREEEWREAAVKFRAEWLQEVGVLVGRLKDALPSGINGFPVFSRFQIIHREDWQRIRTALLREQERLNEFEV
jgi:hypothetical protein